MKKILIAISGGIAAYKAADIISVLKKIGHDVRVITTKNALDFITPTVIGAISGGNYITEENPNVISHIDEAQNCDVFICVPATANIIAKFANGIADDFVSSTFLALPKTTPKIICPAMNTKMWENIATQRNITTLKTQYMNEKIDCKFIYPVEGLLACGDVGIGKLPTTKNIIEEIKECLNNDPIWKFPFEYIKPIGITNDSYSYMHINKREIELPIYPHVGAFGVKRRHDKHRGVDLYVPDGTPVYAVEDGIIKDIRPWTGTKANCDWWENTEAVGVEGLSGLIIYGEISVDVNIYVNDKIKAGQFIGYVKTVLKKDKGRPMSMLHLELREPGFYRNIDKDWDETLPTGIKDPTPQLLRMFKKLI